MNETVATYLMNPAEDMIVFGEDLAEGMWVLPESHLVRQRPRQPEEVQLRAQRFRRVTRLRKESNAYFQGGRATIFVGEWVDGYQEVHKYTVDTAWLVKKATSPEGSHPDPETP